MVDDESLSQQWARLRAERAELDATESEVIAHAMQEARGVVAHAARELGIARTTLASRLEVLGTRARSSSTRVVATRGDDAQPSAATGARGGDAA